MHTSDRTPKRNQVNNDWLKKTYKCMQAASLTVCMGFDLRSCWMLLQIDNNFMNINARVCRGIQSKKTTESKQNFHGKLIPLVKSNGSRCCTQIRSTSIKIKWPNWRGRSRWQRGLYAYTRIALGLWTWPKAALKIGCSAIYKQNWSLAVSWSKFSHFDAEHFLVHQIAAVLFKIIQKDPLHKHHAHGKRFVSVRCSSSSASTVHWERTTAFFFAIIYLCTSGLPAATQHTLQVLVLQKKKKGKKKMKEGKKIHQPRKN